MLRLSVTPVGWTPITVTLQEPFLPPTPSAVMVAVPFFFAVTFPLEETVATAVLLEDQVSAFWPA